MRKNIELIESKIAGGIKNTPSEQLKDSVYWKNRDIMSSCHGLDHAVRAKNIHLVLDYADLVRKELFMCEEKIKISLAGKNIRDSDFFQQCRLTMDSCLKSMVGKDYDILEHTPKEGGIVSGTICRY
jgi:hypothetical protein